MTRHAFVFLLSGFLLLGVFGSSAARASSITVDFTGTITAFQDLIDLNATSPYIGATMHGTIAMTGGPTDQAVIIAGSPATLHDFTVGYYLFEITGGPSYARANNVAHVGIVNHGANPNPSLDHLISAGFYAAGLTFQLAWQPTNDLLSLAAFPSDSATAFPGALFTASGTLLTRDFKIYAFDISSFTANSDPVSLVPIPPALPLLATAVAGLGFAGWSSRRRAIGHR